VAVMTMSYKATLDNIERRLAESKRKLAESCAPNPFIPEGYCPLATAVDRAAAAYFPQEYAATEISPWEEDRFTRRHRAIEDLKHLATWERDAERRRSEAERRRKHAENARRASAGNVNSVPRRASGPNDPFGGLGHSNKGYADIVDAFDATMGIQRTVTDHSDETSLPARPMSEDQEKAARLDAIEDDGVISTQQRMERQEALKDAAWEQVRQHLHQGRLIGFVQGDHGGYPKEMEAGQWSARWAENAHKPDAALNVLVKEAELAALLAGDEPQAHTDAAPKMPRPSTNGPTGSVEPPLRSGLPGRPSSKELYLAEVERRADAGELEDTLADESRYLHKWLPKAHPHNPPSGLSAIKNAIRERFWQCRAASKRDENT
jgi:hypothetical protein